MSGPRSRGLRLAHRDTFVTGRAEIIAFLTQKWQRELDYALRENLWSFDGNRIAVRFQDKSRNRDGQCGAATATSSGSSTSTN